MLRLVVPDRLDPSAAGHLLVMLATALGPVQVQRTMDHGPDQPPRGIRRTMADSPEFDQSFLHGILGQVSPEQDPPRHAQQPVVE